MADFVFNIAKGRVVELYNRVNDNDPANSALVMLVIDANGETDANMKDADTVAALLALTCNEVTNTNYARKTLTDADLAASAVDDTNDLYSVDIDDQTFSNIAAGDAWTDVVIAYDSDTTAGTDANLVPLTCHDFAVTPDGSSIVVQVPSGFFSAA